jgi:uncharacterized protein involved in exopolysaccharide biosynthesis
MATLSVDQAFVALWRRKGLVLFFMVVAGGIGAIYTALVPRSYEATTHLIVHAGRAFENASVDRLSPVAAQERMIQSQIVIVGSEAVLRQALHRIGAITLFPELEPNLSRTFAALQSLVQDNLPRWAFDFAPSTPAMKATPATGGFSSEDRAYLAAKKATKIDAVPNTNIIRISFRHTDPRLTAVFVNEIAASYIARNFELARESSAGVFYQEQRQKYTEHYKREASAYSRYSSERQMFSVSDQRRLALERRSAIAGSLGQTRVVIAEKEAQIDATVKQLQVIKPLANVPQIGQLLADSALGIEKTPKRSDRDGDSRNAAITKDPPLLLVKVYQELVQGLVRVNSELAGLKATEEKQKAELQAIDAELSVLGEREAEFDRLRFDMTQAKDLAEGYAKKAAMQQLDDDSSAAKITNIQIAQLATTPLEPVNPKPLLVMLLSALVGALLGIVIALLKASRAQGSASEGGPLYYPYVQIADVAPIELHRHRRPPQL